MQAQKPLTLHATISLPTSETPEEAETLIGFLRLVALFKPFDETFVGLWNQTTQGCTAEWIVLLHKQLAEALPSYLNNTETQLVDLETSQIWLRTMVWSLSIRHKLLSSSATQQPMTFTYPLELSRSLLVQSSRFSKQAMEVHGIGLVSEMLA